MIDNLRVLLTVVRHPRLARVELGFACFALLEHGGWLAVLVYAFGRGGVSEAGVAALVQLVPAALVAPIAAVAGDRFPRARVLAASHLAQAVAAGVVAVAMFADASPVVVYAAATLLAVTVTFSRPAMGSLLPSVAGSARELTAANVAAGLIENVGRFLGPALAGLIIHLAEPATVFAVAAPMMVGAALLAASVRPESAELLPVVDAERPLRLIGAGFVLIGRQRAPRLVLGVLAALNVVIGALDVMFVGVAVDLLDREESVSGLLSGAAGFGGVLGAVTAVAMVGRRRLTPAIAFGSLLVGGPVIALVGVDGVALAICLLAVSGAGRTVVGIASRSLLQGITPDDVLARVFGVHEGMTMAAYGVGSILVVGLEVWFGLSTTLVVIGLLLPVVVGLLAPGLLALDADRPEPDPAVFGLVRSNSIFRPLPPYVLEQLVVTLERVAPQRGTVLMAQDDPGDVMFLIAEGVATVHRGGQVVRHCGVGEHVGEIALLRDVPRTASVRAGEGLVAYRLERDVFLEAVTGHPRSLARADALATQRLTEPTA